jgi:hypothetical protein
MPVGESRRWETAFKSTTSVITVGFKMLCLVKHEVHLPQKFWGCGDFTCPENLEIERGRFVLCGCWRKRSQKPQRRQ